jgi:penicillin-binding protein 1A
VLPDDRALHSFVPAAATEIFASDGVLLARLGPVNRHPVPLEQIPRSLQDAVVAIEDRRFYEHAGLDGRGIARAVWRNLSAGDPTREGGSTLTQQLARQLFLDHRKRLGRKLTEAVLAVRIERQWSKPRILEAYLNQVYLGSGAYGVASAARAYFGKDVATLDLAECALLAGLLRRPAASDPYRDPRRALERRNLVLDRMADEGFIGADAAERARRQPLRLARGQSPARLGYFRAPYFVAHVVSELERAYGEPAAAGLRVVTTLDSRTQAAAERAVRRGLHRARAAAADDAALVCLDPHTGRIRAMVGGADFSRDQWNCATQARRQPGSTFKPFVYLAALDLGYLSASTLLPGRGTIATAERAALTLPIASEDDEGETRRERRAGWIPLREAVVRSANAAAVYTLLSVGPERVIEYARQFGIRSSMLPYPSLALGACEVTALEMASAYGVLATGGRRCEPVAIRRVEDRHGRLLYRHVPRSSPVPVAPEALAVVDGMLRDVVVAGTGRAAARVPHARGKTGSTNGPRDAWFVGYTPGLVAAVWVGNRDGQSMRYGSGGGLAAPIWAELMTAAARIAPAPALVPPRRFQPTAEPEPNALAERGFDDGEPAEAPAPPSSVSPDTLEGDPALLADASSRGEAEGATTVRVCLESFLRAGAQCASTQALRFDAGTAPDESCSIHAR